MTIWIQDISSLPVMVLTWTEGRHWQTRTIDCQNLVVGHQYHRARRVSPMVYLWVGRGRSEAKRRFAGSQNEATEAWKGIRVDLRVTQG